MQTDGTHLMCEWFVMCDRPAEWVTEGPIGNGLFAMVPVCQRCADRVGLTDLHPYELNATEV